jgi:hypothetical protein
VKSLSGNQTTALQAAGLPIILFAEFDFSTGGGVQRYCTAGYDFYWNPYTWKGLGGLVSLEAIRESSDVEAVGLKATLLGFNNTLYPSPVSVALTEHVQGKSCKIWLGVLNDSYQLVDTPVLEFSGRIDTLTITEDAGTATMSVSMESRFASILRPNVRRYTDADQQHYWPGDKYFEYLPDMREKVLVFPSKEAQRR